MILSERIKEVVKHSGLSIPKFADYVGFTTPQTVRELVNGRTKSLSFAVASKILASYPEISEAWLKEGEGQMLNPQPTVDIDLDLKLGSHSQFAMRDITNIGDVNIQIAILQERIKSLEKELREKDKRIEELNTSLERERKMNDYLMDKK